MIINQNLSAMNAQRNLFKANKALENLAQKISSGNRLGNPGDDPAGLAIGEKLLAQNAGLLTALQNAQDGQALLRVADGGLSMSADMLTRMHELATRAANGTLAESDREAIMDEFNQLRDQMGQIAGNTEYNTKKVLGGELAVNASLSGNAASSMSIVGSPTAVKSGDVAVEVTATATAATMAGNGAAASLSSDGTISVNGAQVNLKAGMSLAEAAAAINSVNDSSQVVATLNSAGDELVLTSGMIDEDAKNALDENDPQRDSVAGFALQGSSYKVNVDGGAVLAELGLSTGEVEGTDVQGTVNGMNMQGQGTVLTNTLEGVAGQGIRIETDQVNGAAGAVIMDRTDGDGGQVRHTSTAGDKVNLSVDVSRALTLHVGANANQMISEGIGSFSPGMLGRGATPRYASLADVNLSTPGNASLALKTIGQALSDVSSQRSRIGATLNRLNYTTDTLAIQHENMSAAQARIMDTNLLEAISQYTTEKIRSQASTAMIAQANTNASNVMRLLGQ